MLRLLVWDIETSSIDILLKTYDLKNRTSWFNHDLITRDWTMLGAAWKFLGEDNIGCLSISPKDPLNDYQVIKKLHKVLDKADVLIGHNSDNFDLKKFNTRAIYYNLPPLQKKKQIDTLKIARKYFKFTSNSLRYISNYLGIEDKGESPDWDKILAGDRNEIRNMREYNKQDVIVTEQLYLKLRSYHETHPDISTVTRDIDGVALDKCPRCDSVSIKKDGTYPVIKAGQIRGRKQRFGCSDCKKLWVGNLIK